MSLPSGVGHLDFIIPAPDSDVSGFTALMDGALLMDDTNYAADCNSIDGTRARFGWDSDGEEIAFDWISDDVQSDPGVVALGVDVVLAASTDAARKIRSYSPNTRNSAYAAGDPRGQYAAYGSTVEAFHPFLSDTNDRTVNAHHITTLNNTTLDTDNPGIGGSLYINGGYATGDSFTTDKISFIGSYKATWSYWGGVSTCLFRNVTNNHLSIRLNNDLGIYSTSSGYDTGDNTAWHIAGATVNGSFEGFIKIDDVLLPTASFGTTGEETQTIGYGRYGYTTASVGYFGLGLWFNSVISESFFDYTNNQISDNSTFWGTPTWVSGGGGTEAEPSDIEGSWVLGSPAVSVAVSVAPSDIYAQFELGSPAVAVKSAVTPEDIASPWELDSPSVAVAVTVTPDDIEALWVIGTPSASIGTMAEPEDVAVAWELESPAVSVAVAVEPEDIDALWWLGSPRVNYDEVTVESVVMSTPLVREAVMSTPLIREAIMKTPLNVVRRES
jgi:hypothetical protein